MLIWQRSRRRRQQLAIVGALICLCLVLLTPQADHGYESITLHRRQVHIQAIDHLHNEHVDFWNSLHNLILNNNPRSAKRPELVVPREPHIVFSSDYEHPRPDVLWIDTSDLSRMKDAHANFILDLQSLTKTLACDSGSRGIVTTATEDALTTLSISIAMIRRTGSELPIEVFLARPSQFTDQYCAKVLKPLNVRCRFLLDTLSAGESVVETHPYQHKIFSIIFSSFENVLFLDSDAWPLTNPDPLFHSLPFLESGLILWPDFWYPSESPYFFEIAKIDNAPPLNQRPATDSGVILYNKTMHAASLMLATYYNYYGPEYYYLLHSQGGPGESDKETYVWAASALKEDFYFVKQETRSLGRHDSSGQYIGTAMVQFDPVQDFFHLAQITAQQPIKDSFAIAHPLEARQVRSSPKPLFVHANHPKIDPYTIFNQDTVNRQAPVRDSNGTWVRAWMPEEDMLQLFGTDVERSFWETIRLVTCDLLRGVGLPTDMQGSAGSDLIRQRDKRVCGKIDEYIRTVFGV